MCRLLFVLPLLPLLAACATGPGRPSSGAPAARPTMTVPLIPAATSETSLSRQDDGVDVPTVLPVGLGITAGPSTVLVGAALDFPMDDNLTFGPAVQYGTDDDVDIFTAFAQAKYWLPGALPQDDGDGRMILRPYIQVGAGFGYLNPKNRSSDQGLILNGGAGFRLLTGKSYRVGTEALVHWAPSKIADEDLWLSWEIVQINFEF